MTLIFIVLIMQTQLLSPRSIPSHFFLFPWNIFSHSLDDKIKIYTFYLSFQHYTSNQLSLTSFKSAIYNIYYLSQVHSLSPPWRPKIVELLLQIRSSKTILGYPRSIIVITPVHRLCYPRTIIVITPVPRLCYPRSVITITPVRPLRVITLKFPISVSSSVPQSRWVLNPKWFTSESVYLFTYFRPDWSKFPKYNLLDPAV